MENISIFEDKEYFMVFFNTHETYEGLELIALKLMEKVGAIFQDKIDGPESRVWKMKIDNCDMSLINNEPYGNFIRVSSIESRVKLNELLTPIDNLFNSSF